jgi:hypothetical protein
MKQRKQMILLYVLPLLAVVVALVVRAEFLLTLILFWGLPSVVLTLWAREHALKALLFATVGMIFMICLDLVFFATKQWYVVTPFNTLFGVVAWADLLYWFLWVYFPILFWEHFYEKKKKEPFWSRKMTRLASVLLLASFAILAAWTWAPHLLQIPYFYLLSTVILIVIPIALEVLAKPKLGFKFLRVALYFAYVAILYELTALYLGQWLYPSDQFIGWIEIVGLRFPIEELFAWILLGSTGILTWYEYFDDDNR